MRDQHTLSYLDKWRANETSDTHTHLLSLSLHNKMFYFFCCSCWYVLSYVCIAIDNKYKVEFRSFPQWFNFWNYTFNYTSKWKKKRSGKKAQMQLQYNACTHLHPSDMNHVRIMCVTYTIISCSFTLVALLPSPPRTFSACTLSWFYRF